ncbi:MAG: SGNH/GDSL hydrolase family protein [Lachnospiraceae bacterium]|nr:SGNH/GDSL hydrolase family protein [Lachnospiraceae bacterium]
MADIQNLLKQLLSAVYGKDVRQAIHDAIHQCYADGKAGSVDLVARENIDLANKRIDNLAKLEEGSTTGDAELQDIRVGADGTIYNNAGEAVRAQVSQLSEMIANWKSGAPEPVSTVAEMTDTTKIYLYTGAEEGYTACDWYYYNDSAWVSGGKYGGSSEDNGFDVKKIGQKIISSAYARIVLLGDSITNGYGGSGYGSAQSNPDGYCWANLFKRYISETYGIPCTVLGYYGSVASLQVTNALNVLAKSDLLIWLTGTNNRDTEELFNAYKNNIVSYVSQLKEKCADILVVGCAPASATDDAGYPKSTRDINDVLISKIYGTAPFISLYERYAEACDRKNITIDSTLSDGLHPNDTGHVIIFQEICKSIGIILNPSLDYSYAGAWWGGNNPDPGGSGDSGTYAYPYDYTVENATITIGSSQNFLINKPIPAGTVREIKIKTFTAGTRNLVFATLNTDTNKATVVKVVEVELTSGVNTISNLDIVLPTECYFVAGAYCTFYDDLEDLTDHPKLPNGTLVEGSDYTVTFGAAAQIGFGISIAIEVNNK